MRERAVKAIAAKSVAGHEVEIIPNGAAGKRGQIKRNRYKEDRNKREAPARN